MEQILGVQDINSNVFDTSWVSYQASRGVIIGAVLLDSVI